MFYVKASEQSFQAPSFLCCSRSTNLSCKGCIVSGSHESDTVMLMPKTSFSLVPSALYYITPLRHMVQPNFDTLHGCRRDSVGHHLRQRSWFGASNSISIRPEPLCEAAIPLPFHCTISAIY